MKLGHLFHKIAVFLAEAMQELQLGQIFIPLLLQNVGHFFSLDKLWWFATGKKSNLFDAKQSRNQAICGSYLTIIKGAELVLGEGHAKRIRDVCHGDRPLIISSQPSCSCQAVIGRNPAPACLFPKNHDVETIAGNGKTVFIAFPSWRLVSCLCLNQSLFLAVFLVFFRKMVGNAFVAIDTGLAVFLRSHVFFVDCLLLDFLAHAIKAVTVPAFP